MAGHLGVVFVSVEPLTAANTETVVQVVAATLHPVKIVGWGISFQGAVVTDLPIIVTLQRQTTAGTSDVLTPEQWKPTRADSFDTTARDNFSAEPTKSGFEHPTRVHPQSGYDIWYPEGKEPEADADNRVGIEVITPAAVNPDCTAYIVFEE